MSRAATLPSATDSICGEPRIAVLIPCYNEAVTIEKVIDDFWRQLPTATIYVYDNNSSDVDADVAVLTDGDDTYPADSVHRLIQPILEDTADMVVGTRLTEHGDHSFR